MRDPEVMLFLLREMADEDNGWIVMPATMGMTVHAQRRRHQPALTLELLIDAGHAQWTTSQMSVARITNAGYDFINAVGRRENVRVKFFERLNAGITYLNSVRAAMDLLK